MKYILVTVAMLVGGSAFAGTDVIAPPVSKYVVVPMPPKRPTCFSQEECKKINTILAASFEVAFSWRMK